MKSVTLLYPSEVVLHLCTIKVGIHGVGVTSVGWWMGVVVELTGVTWSWVLTLLSLLCCVRNRLFRSSWSITVVNS